MRMNLVTRMLKSIDAIGSMASYDKEFCKSLIKMAHEAGIEEGKARARKGVK